MQTVNATHLKNRLGEVLRQASLGPVAIERHGRIVAHLVPVAAASIEAPKSPARPSHWGRREEARVSVLCAQGDFRPSRWRRAGDARTLAGIAVMLASLNGFDRTRMLALAEQLHPGLRSPGAFGRWLAQSPVQASRLLPMIAHAQRNADRAPVAGAP